MAAPVYLSVCAIYRDEAPYLEEWLEFHRLVGVERFFLYNNGSVDFHRKVIAPYIDDGIVTLRDWPHFPASGRLLLAGRATDDKRPGQFSAYDHCLKEHRHDSRWIAFIDIDEFLFSPRGAALPEVLTDYEACPAVGVHWAVFGTSGHRTSPPGLVIENYLYRTNSTEENRFIKSVVDPNRALRCISSHTFAYDGGFAVDENFEQIDSPPFGMTDSVSFSRLRINHYWTKSEEDWERKMARESMLKERFEQEGPEEFYALFNQQYDETITAYAPALREALRRAQRRDEQVS